MGVAGGSEAAHRAVLVGTPLHHEAVPPAGVHAEPPQCVPKEGGQGGTRDSWGPRGVSYSIREAAWRSLAVAGLSSGRPSEEGAQVRAAI